MKSKRKNYFIFFAAISINFICFSTGISYTWTSPMLQKFESNDPAENPIGRPLTTIESGWLVSIINIGLILGAAFPFILSDRIGKRATVLIAALPLLVAHLICVFAKSFQIFLVARFLMGLTSGGAWATLPGYLSEISEPHNRGLLSCLMVAVSSFGTLFTYVVGPYVSVVRFSIINVIFVAVFLILVYFFIPNSPYDLIIKNKLVEAKESLIKLRQSDDVQKEILEIENIIELNSKSRVTICDLFRDKISFRALLICAPLMMFNTWSGMLIILGYTQNIFDMVGSSIPSVYTAIMVGIVSVIGTLSNCQLIDRLGRKPLIILSTILAWASHTILGTYFHLQTRNVDLHAVQWLPICAVITFMFAFNFSMGSLPWIILGELFSPKMKAVASTVCSSVNYVSCLSVTVVYPYLVESIGIANTFLFFAAMMAAFVVFCIVKLPETKGKSFPEIFALLDRKS